MEGIFQPQILLDFFAINHAGGGDRNEHFHLVNMNFGGLSCLGVGLKCSTFSICSEPALYCGCEIRNLEC